MTAAFLLAQLADALTIRWHHEANGLVLALGEDAYLPKALIALAAVLVAALAARARRPELGRALLGVGTTVSLFAVATNLLS